MDPYIILKTGPIKPFNPVAGEPALIRVSDADAAIDPDRGAPHSAGHVAA